MKTTPRIRKRLRRLGRWARKNKRVVVSLVVFLAVVTSYSWYMNTRQLSIDTASYAQLLTVIGTAESSNNYNAYFGNAGNTSTKFTDMSVAEVMQWQHDYIRQGSASSAVGKYQIIDTTLAGLVRQLALDTSRPFDAALQDLLAISLLERRGAGQYINQQLTREQFAANLAKEWAGLPKVIGDKPEESYYASDGLNAARTSTRDVLAAIDALRAK